MSWFRRTKVNSQLQSNKATAGRQSVKGGINVNVGSIEDSHETMVIRLLERLDDKVNLIDKKVVKSLKHTQKNHTDIGRIKTALNIYVANNGVDAATKNAVNEILK